MSTDQEAPGSQVKTESETVAEPHTELAEHEPAIEELQQALAQAEQKAQENWDKAVRAQAEMENLKRRTQRIWKTHINSL